MDGVMQSMDSHEAAAQYIEVRTGEWTSGVVRARGLTGLVYMDYTFGLQAFRAVHREGAVDRGKAIAVLYVRLRFPPPNARQARCAHA